MTESESVALPLGDAAIFSTSVIIAERNRFVNTKMKNSPKSFFFFSCTVCVADEVALGCLVGWGPNRILNLCLRQRLSVPFACPAQALANLLLASQGGEVLNRLK